jgi:hypothetical protein
MPLIADEYQAAMKEADKESLVDIGSIKSQDFSELCKGLPNVIGNVSFSSMAAEKLATSLLGKPVNFSAMLDVATRAATLSGAMGAAKWGAAERAAMLGMTRDVMNVSSIADKVAGSINPPHIQALLTSAKITESINSLRFISGMIDIENLRLSSVIDSVIKSSQFGVNNFSFQYNSHLPALLKTLSPYHEIERSLAQSYELQLGLFQDSYGCLRRHLAELACDVESVKVDIAEGNNQVIHAEYDRGKVIELLSAIIVVKESQPEPSIELEDGYLDTQKLFDCLDDHDTHYGEYTGEVKIRILDKDNPKSLQSFMKELVDAGQVDKDRLEEIEYDARRAEVFFRRNFLKVLYHGLWFLAEASVSYALDNPLPADEYRTLEKKMGDAIRQELPRPSLGGNTRGGDAWEKLPPSQFARKVDELYDSAECLLKGYNKYKPNANWLEMFKLSDEFSNLLKICSDQVINEVAALIPVRLKESRLKSHKHGSTPLAFACELVAHKLNIVKKDGKRYGVESLLRKYRAGGGVRGKQRTQPQTRRKTSQKPQKNAIQ